MHCDISLSRGGYQPPVTPEGGYRHRLAPDYLKVMIASDHSPTDSPCACEVEPTRSYEQAARPASGLPEGNPEAETGRLKRPPSALERAATERTARAGLSAQRMDHQLWDLGIKISMPARVGFGSSNRRLRSGGRAPSSCIDGPRQCQGYPRAGSVGRPVTTRCDVPLKAWTRRDTHRRQLHRQT